MGGVKVKCLFNKMRNGKQGKIAKWQAGQNREKIDKSSRKDYIIRGCCHNGRRSATLVKREVVRYDVDRSSYALFGTYQFCKSDNSSMQKEMTALPSHGSGQIFLIN